jgi:hypothetical protein
MRNAGDLTIVDYDQRINELRLEYNLQTFILNKKKYSKKAF